MFVEGCADAALAASIFHDAMQGLGELKRFLASHGVPVRLSCMIIPCIDLQDGRAVQLVHGRKRRLAVDDVFGLLERFRDYPLLHVIDLDAAMGKGSNARLVGALCRRAPMRVRVGGGIRTTARAAAPAGRRRGKDHRRQRGLSRRPRQSRASSRGLAKRVGRRRVIVAVDTDGGQILVRGWQEKLRLRPDRRLRGTCSNYASEFLCTYVDNEGTMRGTNLAWFRALRRATPLPITAAGGIRSQQRSPRPRTHRHERRRRHGAVPQQAPLSVDSCGVRTISTGCHPEALLSEGSAVRPSSVVSKLRHYPAVGSRR